MSGENDGGVGGVRVEEHYRTRVRGIMALLADNGRVPEARDIAIARHLVAEGRRSKFSRNKLAAGRLSLMIAEAERRHQRWAMEFEQRERHHEHKMRGFDRRTQVIEQRGTAVGDVHLHTGPTIILEGDEWKQLRDDLSGTSSTAQLNGSSSAARRQS